jgi:hypothetical protein
LELCSRDATTVRITYGRGCEDLTDASHKPPRKRGATLTTARAGKRNSLWGVMPMHSTYYGAAPAPIQEEKDS